MPRFWTSLLFLENCAVASKEMRSLRQGVPRTISSSPLFRTPAMLMGRGFDMPDDGAYDVIRDGAASLGVGLVRLEQQRHRLEDLFREEADDGDPARV